MALEIFRAISNLRLVLETETDYDSPDNETTYKAVREMIEILYQLLLDTGDSGTATANPTETTLTDSGAAYDVDKHNGRTLVICSGKAKGTFYTIDDTTATTIVCTGDTLLADGVLSGDDYKILYDIKTHTSGHTHDGFNSAGASVADNQITQAKMADNAIGQAEMADSAIGQAELKTGFAESLNAINAGSSTLCWLPGGVYGFPTFYVKADIGTYVTTAGYVGQVCTTSYAYITFKMSNSDSSQHYGYIYQKYITASGEVFWHMTLREKSTGNIISKYCGPDHPCMQQNKDPEDYPHPWVDEFDSEQHEIIVVNPDKNMLENIRKSRSKSGLSVLETIENEYDLDETTEPNWPTEKVTVGLPPDWEEKAMGDSIVPIRKVIPKPAYVKTAALKLKQIKGVEL